MKPYFLEDWSEDSTQYERWNVEGTGPIAHIKADFEISDEELDGINILLAYYSYRNWEGDAFVLFEKDGKLFEVNGGHCSCYGLEGQWEPEEVTIDVLEYRLNKGNLGVDSWENENRFAKELREVISELKEAK